MKTTNIPIYIMYLWAALVLAACTGDDDAAWPEGGVPLELYAAVEGYSSANAQTRATTENRWEGGERVMLWIIRGDGVMNMVDNFSVKPDGKLSVSGMEYNWANLDEEKKIYGLYPSSRNIRMRCALLPYCRIYLAQLSIRIWWTTRKNWTEPR